MGLATTAELLTSAAADSRGLAAFNVITLEYAEAIVRGAESVDRPVILQLSENAVRFHGGAPRPLTAAMRELAAASSVGVSLHLDHVEEEELLRQSADAGFSSVMFDAGRLPYEENEASTARAAEWAHAAGLLVEAELGFVGGKDSQTTSAHAPGTRTDPDQATAFVAATGVDALAVAVGSSHAMTQRTAALDEELIAALHAAVGVPLVLHGSSGVPDDDLRRAVAAGITKVNVGTLLSVAYTSAVRDFLDGDAQATDPRKYLAPARDKISSVVADLLLVIDHRP
ncbi:MAG: class II fructose-bisphosphate aldolase [Propionibacteriaceae bacterium]